MTFQSLRKVFFLLLIQHLSLTGCGTHEILLECDVSEIHTNKNSCSFTTTTCIVEEFRDVWLSHVKLSFTNARDENFTAMIFQNSYVPILPVEVFEQFPNLESLDFSNTGMTMIRGRSFANASELVELNLSNNRLKEITGQTFVGATKLKSLHLANNRIVTVWTNAFRDTVNLEYIDLCHNLIQVIHKETFSMLGNLRNVYLYRNSIIDVNPLSFAHNKQLNTIDLTGNVLREVVLELSSVRLNKLDLSNCSLDELTLRKSSDTSDNITIRYLSVSHNEFTNMSKIHVDKGVKLQNVDLSQNRLRSLNIGPDYIRDITTLKLAKNELWEISPGFLSRLLKLKALYLDKNALRLYPSMFQPVPELKILSLSENRLKFFNLSWFGGLPNLTQLNLEDNLLHYINYTSIMSILPSLQSLFIDNNKFTCSFVETMVNYVRNTTEGKSIEFSSSGRGMYPTCVADEQEGGSYWGWIVVGVVFSAMLALIIIMRRQLVERFDDVRRRLRSYSNMRETGTGSSRLGDEGDD